MPAVRSRRRAESAAAALAATVVSVSACSSSSPPELGASPRVTASGKHYTFAQSHVRKTQWPNPCSLLTRASAEAAIGTSVTVKRFHTNCYFQPGSAEYPRLTVTLLAVGTGSESSYDGARSHVNRKRTSVSGVGRSAYLHAVAPEPSYRLDVLTAYAHFAVSEQSPFSQRLTASQARRMLSRVGRAVAKAFAG